ncbi:MAG: hypothetical protein V2J51_15605 [Erythrobacter sp.]|nr:hypothetical protein [Erythrobacter sp.]
MPTIRQLGWTGGLIAAAAVLTAPAHAAVPAPIGTFGYATSTLSGHAPASGSPFSSSTYDVEADTADWRGRRWGRRGGWGRRGWRGHRRGIGAGEVLAGVAIIGGIAAIASAANNDRRRYRDRDVVVVDRDNRYERDREWQQQREIDDLRRRTEEQQRELEYLRSREFDVRSGSREPIDAVPQVQRYAPAPQQPERFGAPITIDTAIDRCVEVVAIEEPVEEVEGVVPNGNGWNVTGRLSDGQGFTCRIDRNGQIEALDNVRNLRGVSYDQQGTQPAAGQWGADRYADARATLVRSADLRQPVYPGGPLPGEDVGG